jgi:sugar phosphate permease
MGRLAVRISQDQRAVGILFLAQIMASAGVFAISPLTPFIQEDLGLSRAEVGFFVSALFVGAMLAAFPAGRMVDRFNPRPLILAGLLVLGTFLMAASLAESVPLMLVLLALAGTGQGLSSPALTTAASLWVSPVIRGTAMGIKQSGVPGGAALSAAILPTVALMTAWRFSLLGTGLVIIAASLVTNWLLRHYVQRDRTDMAKAGSAHTLRAHVWRKDILLIIGSQVCLLFAQFAFVAYFVLYLTETLLFAVVMAGLCLSLAQATAWVGRIGWGVLSDRVLGGNRRISYGIMALLAAAFMFLISLISIDTPVWIVVCVSIAFGLTGLSWGPTFLNCVTEMAGPAMAGTAVGLGVGIGYTVNIAGVPFLGYLADWTGTYRATWQFAAACALAGFVLIVLAGQCKEDYSWGSVT